MTAIDSRVQIKFTNSRKYKRKVDNPKMIWFCLYIFGSMLGVLMFDDVWIELGELEGWRSYVAQGIFFLTGIVWGLQFAVMMVLVLFGYEEEE